MPSETIVAGLPTDETAPFWDAAARDALLLRRCLDTGQVFHYPREHSPFTGGATEWVEVSGKGEIYSCSLAYRAKPPYCIAYIQLDEGPILLSNVECDDLDAVAIGQRVQVFFREDDTGRKVPMFEPAMA